MYSKARPTSSRKICSYHNMCSFVFSAICSQNPWGAFRLVRVVSNYKAMDDSGAHRFGRYVCAFPSPVAFVGVDAACVSVAGPSDEKAVMCNRSGRLLQLSTVAGAV